jgi:hypothetical protein
MSVVNGMRNELTICMCIDERGSCVGQIDEWDESSERRERGVDAVGEGAVTGAGHGL